MKPPAFQFYPDDFIGGTVMLTAEETGAYMRLLCFQWGNGRIPERKDLVDRIAGCEVSKDVMEKFPKGKNARMEEERVKQAKFRKERAQSGAKGAEKRWHSSANGSANGSAIEQPMAKNGSPSPSPSPSPIDEPKRHQSLGKDEPLCSKERAAIAPKEVLE
jgi:uncharacterized protein YdaU (DUF1376 family)